MIHGIKLRIKDQKEKMKLELSKSPKEQDSQKIQYIKRSISAKKRRIKELKLKKWKKK